MAPRPLEKNILNLIMNALDHYFSREEKLCSYFMERVTEKEAYDYRDHIPGEMFLKLIKERVFYKYYRSVDQIFADIDQIHKNSMIYNGDDVKLT